MNAPLLVPVDDAATYAVSSVVRADNFGRYDSFVRAEKGASRLVALEGSSVVFFWFRGSHAMSKARLSFCA